MLTHIYIYASSKTVMYVFEKPNGWCNYYQMYLDNIERHAALDAAWRNDCPITVKP